MYRIYKAIKEPLSAIENHNNIKGIERSLLLKSPNKLSGISHLAIHRIDGISRPHNIFCYSKEHKHEEDELNIIIPDEGGLAFLYEINGERFEIDEQCAVLIQMGAAHCMEAISGSGSFVCIHLK